MSADVALLVESLERPPIGENTHTVNQGKWNTWQELMNNKRRGQWLHMIEKETEVRSLLLGFMACRLFFSLIPVKLPVLGGISPLSSFSTCHTYVG